jgi:hypothetical protein
VRNQQYEVAVALTQATQDVLRVAVINNTLQFFCKRRYLERNTRPTVSDAEITQFVGLSTKREWTWDDLMLYITMRQFDSQKCTCDDWQQYICCSHSGGTGETRVARTTERKADYAKETEKT